MRKKSTRTIVAGTKPTLIAKIESAATVAETLDATYEYPRLLL